MPGIRAVINFVRAISSIKRFRMSQTVWMSCIY